MTSKSLQTYFDNEIDLVKFWQIADQLPSMTRQKYSSSHILRLRFHDDGTVKHTFQQIADELGMNTAAQARGLLMRAIFYMRQSRRLF